MMKKALLLFLVVSLITMLAACGSGTTTLKTEENANMSYEKPADTGNGFDYDFADEPSLPEENLSGEITQNDLENRKMIKDADMTVKTDGFDGFLTNIKEKTVQIGGYVQTVSLNQTTGNRTANLQLRIPADKFDAFISDLSHSVAVQNYNETIEDVTMEYTDIESRIQALRTEQETLLGLLSKAEDLDSIIKLQDRLSEVRAEIDAYESQKRSYDNLITYSTLSLTVREVEFLAAPSGTEKSIWQEIGRSLSENLYDIGQGFRGFFIWLAGNLPYWILLTILVTAAALILRHIIRRKKHKKETQSKENSQP